MRRISLLIAFLVAAVASGRLVFVVHDLVPDRPPPVRPIDLAVSTSLAATTSTTVPVTTSIQLQAPSSVVGDG